MESSFLYHHSHLQTGPSQSPLLGLSTSLCPLNGAQPSLPGTQEPHDRPPRLSGLPSSPPSGRCLIPPNLCLCWSLSLQHHYPDPPKLRLWLGCSPLWVPPSQC